MSLTYSNPFLTELGYCQTFLSAFAPMAEPSKPHAHVHAHAHEHAASAIKAAQGDDFTEKNRAHWDAHARRYTSEPWQQEMMAQLATFLSREADWLGLPSVSGGRPVRVLDYACGPGTVTAILGGRATEWRGLDLSAEMCNAYNERFAGETAFTAHAVQGNLLKEGGDEAFQGPEWWDFDMVDIGLGFHHFENPAAATKTLVQRLRPGGVFMIVDLVNHELEEDFKHIVAHAGFSFETVKKLFEGEGLMDVEWRVMDQDVMIKGRNPRRVFVARGRKPESNAGRALLS